MSRHRVAGLALALLAVVPPAGAGAGVATAPNCVFRPSTGALEVTSPNSSANTFIGVDENGAIFATEHTFPQGRPEVITPIPCQDAEGGSAGPTVANTDTGLMTATGTVVITPLAPGRTVEEGADEIEMTVDGPSASIKPVSSDVAFDFGADAAGTLGANLNAGIESAAEADADLLFTTPLAVLVLPGGGQNVIDGTGFEALPQPFPGTLRGFGGNGRDEFTTGVGPVSLYAGAGGRDVLRGGNGEDEFTGGGGDDRLVGEGGRDALTGNGGDDALNGGRTADELLGSGGDDRITGGDGRDRLLGAAGEDLLFARDGERDVEISCWTGDDSKEAARVDGKDPEPIGC